MIVVFIAFGVTGPIPPTELGVTLALAVLLDATIVRMMLVPSISGLLGERNWWPPAGWGSGRPSSASTTDGTTLPRLFGLGLNVPDRSRSATRADDGPAAPGSSSSDRVGASATMRPLVEDDGAGARRQRNGGRG